MVIKIVATAKPKGYHIESSPHRNNIVFNLKDTSHEHLLARKTLALFERRIQEPHCPIEPRRLDVQIRQDPNVLQSLHIEINTIVPDAGIEITSRRQRSRRLDVETTLPTRLPRNTRFQFPAPEQPEGLRSREGEGDGPDDDFEETEDGDRGLVVEELRTVFEVFDIRQSHEGDGTPDDGEDD